jgi:glutamate-1-semialdehyde 2,1-aminomutase
MTRGRGSRVRDVDGNEYIDYMLGHGSAILGHGDPGIARQVAERVAHGTAFGTANELEVALAKKISELVPYAELVRFANSGSEAICAAVRIARAKSGRNKVLKFEGHYHGWLDVLAVSTRPEAAKCGPLESPDSDVQTLGVPANVTDDVIVCPWNHPDVFEAILSRHADTIAAVIAEPIVANNACIMPRAGFLQALRRGCDRHDVALIFDEVCTGFRVALGGAADLFRVEPDLVVYSKAIGGGLPLSVVAGRERFMKLVASSAVRHGGTYNGNPLCVSAALYTLEELSKPEAQSQLRANGLEVKAALERSALKYAVPCVVQGVAQMFQVVFGVTEPQTHYRDLLRSDYEKYQIYRDLLLRRGVHIGHSPLSSWFVSTAHSSHDTEFAANAIDQSMKDLVAHSQAEGPSHKKCSS